MTTADATGLAPRVSICVPNLNTRPFLPERFRTIFEQTFTDWELLVYDSYSTDGAWEYILEVAGREPRVRAWQGPREGTPGSWNPCIRAARGEYVYIATSDDTMALDCVEKLAAALDANPDCDIAHCALRPIDEHGRELMAMSSWWRNAVFAESSGSLFAQPHARRAPFDGLLHLLGGSVYISITQLLIRRSLFDRIGYFESTWGSVGDFNWNMRATLLANTVHVPDTWGGWRLHSTQATAGVKLDSAEHAVKIDSMIDHAIAQCEDSLDPTVRRHLLRQWAAEAKQFRDLTRELGRRQRLSLVQRRLHLAVRCCTSATAREYVRRRMRHQPFSEWIQGRLVAAGYHPTLVPAANPGITQVGESRTSPQTWSPRER